MKRVVAIVRVEADLDVVILSVQFFENGTDLMAEVAFHFQDKAADPFLRIFGSMSQQLPGERIHAAARLAGAHCPEDCDACEQASFWDDEPPGILSRDRLARVVDLAQDQKELFSLPSVRVRR